MPSGVTEVEILVVAGGGSGGPGPKSDLQNFRSGGGAAGLIHIANWNISGASTVTVAIGAGGTVYMDGTVAASNGEDSTVDTDTGHRLTAKGGGHGGYRWNFFSPPTKPEDPTKPAMHRDSLWLHPRYGGSGGGGLHKEGDWYGKSTQSTDTNDNHNTYANTGHGHDGGEGRMWHGGGAGGADEGIFPMESAGPGLDLSTTLGTSVGDDGWFASGGTSLNNGSDQIRRHRSKGGGGWGHNGTFDKLMWASRMKVPKNVIANGLANTGGGGSGVVIIRYLPVTPRIPRPVIL